MHRIVYIIILTTLSCVGWAQKADSDSFSVQKDTLKSLDYNYREDQFYVGITHTMLQSKPSKFSPRGFSLGLQLGFLRDFPINAKRTWAIAPGVGYSYFGLRNNLAYTPEELQNYQILETYKNNIQHLHYLDIPVEIRWRTSTPESHKFWRIYLGFKASYLLANKVKVNSDQAGYYATKNNKGFSKWHYSVYLSAGFNTWNIYLNYGLNTLYSSDLFDGDSERLRFFNAGLIFYIL